MLVLVNSTLCPLAQAETIILKSGSVISAKIIEYAPDRIKVDVSGVTLTYFNDQIKSIQPDLAKIDTLTSAPKSIPAENLGNLIEKISQSVVIIEAKKQSNTMQGTGFFVSCDGLVATNLHVIYNSPAIVVRTKSGAEYPVQFIANYNDDLDICLLKIDIVDAPVLALGNSDNLKAGQILFTIGHRQGAFYQASSGPFVGKKTIDGEENLQSKFISGHGNSGGPILDQNGMLVGISKAFSPQSGDNFGIPINEAKKFLVYNEPLTVNDFNRQISPANALAFAAEGTFLAGNYRQALEDFKKSLELDPTYLKALLGIAKSYSAMNMENEALNAWQEVNKRDPNNVVSLIHLGKIYLKRNNLDEGIVNLQKAVDLAPQIMDVYSDLGYAYGQKGKLNEAIKVYKKLLELNPVDANSNYNLAVAYFNKQSFRLAKEYSLKAQNLGYAIPESFLKQLSTAEKFGDTFEIK